MLFCPFQSERGAHSHFQLLSLNLARPSVSDLGERCPRGSSHQRSQTTRSARCSREEAIGSLESHESGGRSLGERGGRSSSEKGEGGRECEDRSRGSRCDSGIEGKGTSSGRYAFFCGVAVASGKWSFGGRCMHGRFSLFSFFWRGRGEKRMARPF